MRYQVPQFIEIEDKIFGPLTIRQFIYLAGGAALSYLVYAFTSAYLPFLIIIVLILPILAFAVALAFYKINNKPFINVIESATKYYLSSKLYIWKKDERPVVKKTETGQTPDILTLPRLSDSKLKDLAWNLDISQSETNQKIDNQFKV